MDLFSAEQLVHPQSVVPEQPFSAEHSQPSQASVLVEPHPQEPVSFAVVLLVTVFEQLKYAIGIFLFLYLEWSLCQYMPNKKRSELTAHSFLCLCFMNIRTDPRLLV